MWNGQTDPFLRTNEKAPIKLLHILHDVSHCNYTTSLLTQVAYITPSWPLCFTFKVAQSAEDQLCSSAHFSPAPCICPCCYLWFAFLLTEGQFYFGFFFLSFLKMRHIKACRKSWVRSETSISFFLACFSVPKEGREGDTVGMQSCFSW